MFCVGAGLHPVKMLGTNKQAKPFRPTDRCSLLRIVLRRLFNVAQNKFSLKSNHLQHIEAHV